MSRSASALDRWRRPEDESLTTILMSSQAADLRPPLVIANATTSFGQSMFFVPAVFVSCAAVVSVHRTQW